MEKILEESPKHAKEFRDRVRDIVWRKERVEESFKPVVDRHKSLYFRR